MMTSARTVSSNETVERQGASFGATSSVSLARFQAHLLGNLSTLNGTPYAPGPGQESVT